MKSFKILLIIFIICFNNAQAYKIESDWGGHLRFDGSISKYDEDSIGYAFGKINCFDENINLRLKNNLFFSDFLKLETHYETVRSRGDNRKLLSDIRKSTYSGFAPDFTIDDKTRLMDLTKTIRTKDDEIIYHRLDRLVITYESEKFVANMGRQALTWGNGMVFNPFDLFNPFSPTDVRRDYKIGDDMLSIQTMDWSIFDMQIIYVPRRDKNNGDIKFDESSVACKFDYSWGASEFDFMYARHYDDSVLGIGSIAYIKDAAWRMDAVLTLSTEPSDEFFAFITNIDYSWSWFKKNCYGYIELYYNDLGSGSYEKALQNQELAERLQRGEIFTFGKTYACVLLNIELHPLVNYNISTIVNIKDHSNILQSWITWDVLENVRVDLGVDLKNGDSNTEFGSIAITGEDYNYKPPDSFYIWITHFF